VVSVGLGFLGLVVPIRAAEPERAPATSAAGAFQNQILISGVFQLPTGVKFLPDGTLLVLELGGKIWRVSGVTWDVSPTPFLLIGNIGTVNGQQGLMDLVLDPDFSSNRYYYVFYTLGSPNRDRASRFTATADLAGTEPGSELVVYEDPQDANAEHHGGALNFGNDGKLYVTTGEHFNANDAQSLTSPRGKVLRFNKDGTVPADNPFYDGPGPNVDAIWALGLRNPYRASYDSVTGRLYIGDVGGNVNATAREELNVGAAGANFGWPSCEGASCTDGAHVYTSPLFSYGHDDALHPLPGGRDACITGGFVYRGSQFPSEYYGNYFFADYSQNWIKRLTLDAGGAVTGVFNFEPVDGSSDGDSGDIVGLTPGPDGALYYVDLGYSDTTYTTGVSKIRRIRYVANDLPPTAVASAQPTQGPAPLTVNFSSAGSLDPEGDPLTFAWTFGDGGTAALANPAHTFASDGPYTVRLTVSDGTVSSFATVGIRVGNPPVPTISAPLDGVLFRAGDVIPFSGSATDPEDGVLPASGFTWNIDFLHEGHIHPTLPQVGVRSGTFVIPSTGHDFHEFTRYRLTLTVTDSDGLQGQSSVIIFPDKVNLSFDTTPSAVALTLDGVPHTTPFVYDTLKGFRHELGAPDPPGLGFVSWSDGGARNHTLVVPGADAALAASYKVIGFFNSVTPCRLVDTRSTAGLAAGAPSLKGGETRTVAIADRCGLSPTARSLSVNLTVTGPTAAGFLTVYPADGPTPPLASSINFAAGDTRANNAVVTLAASGAGLKVFNGSSGSVDLVIDVNGWFE
jgi:glucose/arabinose dehydrogenase